MKITYTFLFALISLFISFTSAHADWKLETINNVQVHFYLPKSESTAKRALMINLHGCAQKAEDLKKDGNWEATADDYNMIVALPKVPNGGVYSGCWDYYGADHTVTNRHNGAILSVVKGLLEKADLAIDSNQVYVSGLSSGGGESMVLGCLAPDVFAGIGLNAGPSTGTTANEISRPKTSYQSMFDTCKKLGAGKESFFKTQLTSIIYGNNDYIVNTAFNTNNAEIMRTLYEANNKSTFDTKKLEGTLTDGTGTLFSDDKGPRVSLIMNTNLGHNWPAGQGGNGGSFINKKSINYPAYITKFFFENNRRARSIHLPEVLVDPIESKGSKFLVSGEVTIPLDHIETLEAVIKRKDGSLLERLPLTIGSDSRFFAQSKIYPDGFYDLDLEMKSTKGFSRAFKRSSWLGKIPGVNPPQLINTEFQSVLACAEVKGQTISNGSSKVTKVVALLDGIETFEVAVEYTRWQLKTCSLKDGDHTLIVHSENEDGMSSNEVEFTFTTSQNSATATVQEHMESGRLKWEQYGYYHQKYGNEKFTIYLDSTGVWGEKKRK